MCLCHLHVLSVTRCVANRRTLAKFQQFLNQTSLPISLWRMPKKKWSAWTLTSKHVPLVSFIV